MPTEDMMTMKPFADVGIRRHSEDDKRHGCYGKSCKRVSEYVRRQLTDEKLDRQLPFSRSPNKLSVQWTAFEVEGERDCMHSLRDSYAWEDVPSLLAQHTIKEPIVQKSADGTLQTTYQLEPVLEQIFDVVNADKAHSKARRWPETDGKIYQLRPHSKRPVLFAVPPDEAPGGVAGKLLQPVRIGEVRSVHQMPIVRKNHARFAWDVMEHGGVGNAQLEIDLGGDCLLSTLSTQGRMPPTRQFPSIRRERRQVSADVHGQMYSRSLAGLGRRAKRSALEARQQVLSGDEPAMNESYSVEGRPRWNLQTHGKYEGPFWQVLDLKGEVERCPSTRRQYTPGERWMQWVTRYTVHARVDGGRGWVQIGVFKGNTNATDEVAHDVRGLRARYLRITPLEVEGGGALRVGLYGLGVAAVANGERLAGHSAGQTTTEEQPEPIAYTLCTAPPSLNTRYTHCERHTYRGHKWQYDDCAPKSSLRGARRMQAWHEVSFEADEAEWAAEWAEAELMADAIEDSKAEAEAQEEMLMADEAKVQTFAMIAACDHEYSSSFLAAHGGNLERAIHSFVESSGDAQELLAEVDLLSEASSCLLRSSSACSSELSSEAVAVDLADVTTSEWSDVAEESDVEQELS